MNTYTLNTRSITAAIFVVAMIAFASIALPHFAFAQDDGDFGGDDSGCCDTSGDTYYSTYSPDTTDYYSTASPDSTDYYSTASPDSTDYYSTASPDSTDYYSTASPDDTDYYSTYDSTSPDYSYTDYTTDEYDTAAYSTGATGSTGSYSSQPFSISAPQSYYSTPSYSAPISAPIIQSAPIQYQQQQQQQQQQQVAPAPVTNNTCVNYSCNTTTSISNSGNTTTVIPVTSTPVTYPVQYTFPQNVSCTITASPNSIQSGQYTLLSWQAYGATSATLTNYGNVAPDGSLSVQPYGSTNYVLTVYGQNGQTATCNTYITLANSYPSVTLSQIPYTGFDFGTLGDAMYWAMLAVFALAAGYLLVYYKGGMGAFAYSMNSRQAGSTSTTSHTTVSKVEKKVTPTPVIVEKRIETPAPTRIATLESLPAFSQVRPTSDSMSISRDGGAPRIVISRS